MKVGDVVRLRSGGDLMTVAKLCEQDGEVMCAWFPVVSYSELSAGAQPMYSPLPERMTFPIDTLINVNEPHTT